MKILFISLGCDKNLVDSEVMLSIIAEKGYEITDDELEADVIVVNTCCFINDAKEESILTILEMAELKKTSGLKALIVTGCLAQRYKEDILKEIPEVDAIIGTTGVESIVSVIDEVLNGKTLIQKFQDINYLSKEERKRTNITGGYFSYLKIAEGCNKCCTYCIIPKVRGRYRSFPMERLINEAVSLVRSGVKELIIVAQETTVYGQDLYGEKKLPELLRKLCKIEGLEWIRILYCYPEEITDELIDVIKEEEKICNYLDIPIQHASDSILKKMGRKTEQKQLVRIIKKLRSEIPDIALRTTLITGFPGETEEDIKEMENFVKQMRFERLGVFTYSAEDDTPAAKMDGQIPEEVKERRRDSIMQLQQKIAFENGQEMVGKTLDVIVEGKLSEDNIYIGRSYMDAPNVDGYIFVDSEEQLMSGDMIRVKITSAKEYDLIGKTI